MASNHQIEKWVRDVLLVDAWMHRHHCCQSKGDKSKLPCVTVSDIFLSYASIERDRVQPLVAALEGRGWSLWWDKTIQPGERWDTVLEAALSQAKCVVVLWTSSSVESPWVRTEAEDGRQRNILVPVLLDRVTVPLAFRFIQAANLAAWAGDPANPEFEKLCLAISDKLQSRAPAKPLSGSADTGRMPIVNRRQVELAIYETTLNARRSWTSVHLADFHETVGPDQDIALVEVFKSLHSAKVLALGKWNSLGAFEMYPSTMTEHEFFCSGEFDIIVTDGGRKHFKKLAKQSGGKTR